MSRAIALVSVVSSSLCFVLGCASQPVVVPPQLVSVPADAVLKLVVQFEASALKEGDLPIIVIPNHGEPYLAVYQMSKPDRRYFAPLQPNRTTYEFGLDDFILEDGGEIVVELWDDDTLSSEDVERIEQAARASTGLLVGIARSAGVAIYANPNDVANLASAICHFNMNDWDLIAQGRYKVPPNGFTREVYANPIVLLCAQDREKKGSFRVFKTRNR